MTSPDPRTDFDERRLRSLRRTAREAANSYVGRHWPSMEAMRRDGIGYALVENREKDPAIRRFIATFSPEFVTTILAAMTSPDPREREEPRPMDPLDESLARRALRKAAMTDRPVADREPLSAEDARKRLLWAWFAAHPNQPMPEGKAEVERLLATLDAARSRPDEARLREALDWMRQVIDRHSDECTVLRTASEGGAETDLDSAFGDVTLAFEEGPFRSVAQPAVPVAGAEDWYDRDAKAFARAHAQTAALRAAQPEDDGLDRSGVDDVGELRDVIEELLEHMPPDDQPCGARDRARVALATTQPERRDGA